MVMARGAGYVPSKGLSGRRSTRIRANSGAHLLIGSSSRIAPCSISIIATTETTGLLIEAIRKIVSRSTGDFVSISRKPTVSSCSNSPPRQTRETAPGISPVATALRAGAAMRAKSSGRRVLPISIATHMMAFLRKENTRFLCGAYPSSAHWIQRFPNPQGNPTDP